MQTYRVDPKAIPNGTQVVTILAESGKFLTVQFENSPRRVNIPLGGHAIVAGREFRAGRTENGEVEIEVLTRNEVARELRHSLDVRRFARSKHPRRTSERRRFRNERRSREIVGEVLEKVEALHRWKTIEFRRKEIRRDRRNRKWASFLPVEAST